MLCCEKCNGDQYRLMQQVNGETRPGKISSRGPGAVETVLAESDQRKNTDPAKQRVEQINPEPHPYVQHEEEKQFGGGQEDSGSAQRQTIPLEAINRFVAAKEKEAKQKQ